MSLDLYFNKPIPTNEELVKHGLRIEKDESESIFGSLTLPSTPMYFIVDEYGNSGFIDHSYENSDSLELTFQGRNNPYKILDTMVIDFGMKFFSDNEEEMLFRGDIDENVDICDITMKRFGYIIDGKITTEYLDEEKYKMVEE